MLMIKKCKSHLDNRCLSGFYIYWVLFIHQKSPFGSSS
ncbi:hypothetical protein AsAng_0045820 [Aureispira anguillae]|uniref:Uncharacterized protein n=1 Tax=Aureispira anguillae TaxID=2864201 RepID=A0A915YIH5_9BACT|nr:hypothetical protein AsAng_0045820 [Aureispira anguillae]